MSKFSKDLIEACLPSSRLWPHRSQLQLQPGRLQKILTKRMQRERTTVQDPIQIVWPCCSMRMFLLSTKKVNANETPFNKSSCGYEQNEIPETLVLKGFQALSQPYLQVCSSVASTNANKDGKVHASLDFETLFCLFLCFSMCWSSLFFQKQRHFANILAEQPM